MIRPINLKPNLIVALSLIMNIKSCSLCLILYKASSFVGNHVWMDFKFEEFKQFLEISIKDNFLLHFMMQLILYFSYSKIICQNLKSLDYYMKFSLLPRNFLFLNAACTVMEQLQFDTKYWKRFKIGWIMNN